ncbi:jg13952 [Pararge aegeria aegeria]|uniref:Jg13952 protein n=1 Tax=Pararge aegeria aegeria TaxID=348720 RepID=A0A8S4QMI1_9NEOP|nr:jg13952 [Pararge aegeria aegeria]
MASSSAGILVEEARDDLSPAFHQPPQAADRLFGLYRGGPRNGTAIVSLPTEQTNSKTNRAGKEKRKER